MKRATLTLVISFAFGALAHAGPEAFSGKEMKQVAPPSTPECFNWSGFYVGAFGGYKFGSTDIDTDLTGQWDLGPPNDSDTIDRNIIESRSAHNLDCSGAEAGGVIGYNLQWRNWVVGLEADGGYLWLRDSHNTGIFEASPKLFYSVENSLKTHYLFTVGPRIGYAFCRWLPYVTGGLSVGDIDFHQGVAEHGLFFHDEGHVQEARAGWMAGGGLEYALAGHWRVRAQYQFIDLGCAGFHAIGTPGSEAYTSDPNACLREHNASLALIYGF